MKLISTFWSREPVVFVASVIGVVDALLGVGAAASIIHLTPILVGAIGTLELAVGTFIQRSQVSPTSSVTPTPPAA